VRHHQKLLVEAKTEGKSYGGIVELIIKNPPKYLGEPIFDKLKDRLSSAFMSVGATIGVEFGEGFESSNFEGSQFHHSLENPSYGGIRGGMSTGENIIVRIAFKPTSSVLDVAKKGRHDPCIVPRAIPVLEAMAWWVLADFILLKRLNNLD
jgi:chorismate synthase